MEEQENQMNIELSEDIALGVYSKLCRECPKEKYGLVS
jgi:hypothetical protein